MQEKFQKYLIRKLEREYEIYVDTLFFSKFSTG